MADTQRSPVLVQHPSPAHTLSLEVSLAPLSSPVSQIHTVEDQTRAPSIMDASEQQESARPEPEADTPMPEAPTSEPHPEPTPETVPQPDSSSAQSEQEQPQPSSESTQLLDPPTDPPTENASTEPPAVDDGHVQTEDNAASNAEEQPSITQMEPEPPPPPEWVTWEDDTSVPSEEEMKEFEGTDAYLSALDVAAHEKKLFRDWPDPDQRPVKKIRLSWVIKGVRGTRERPNMARTMHSPAAFIDGKYWQIKFYPRGNKNSSISAYIRCTPNKPTPDSEIPESTFAYFEGPPDANVGEGAEPKEIVKTEATPIKKDDKPETSTQDHSSVEKGAEGESLTEPTNPTASQTIPPPQGDTTDSTDADGRSPAEPANPATSQDAQTPQNETGNTTDTDVEMKDEVSTPAKKDEDFRVSAQLGMIIYNPEEPRTGTYMSSEHQFNSYNDDWGWTNFVGPWNEIHVRQRGQFQALLRNDTLAIDAYILIFDDPTQALWWHESNEHESVWPSKKLAGFFPMGTQPLYHSPLVAGITAWSLLEPFRKVLQGLDAGAWRQNSQVRPRPLVASLQYDLHNMRHLTRDTYVNLGKSYDCIKDYAETYSDVVSFWEVLRRSIELEIADEHEALTSLSDIFDVNGKRIKVPSLPVKGVKDIQQALQKVTLPPGLENSGPEFLPLVLKREVFDQTKREWKLHHDRVALNEEVELPGSLERYSLYGFVVHVGERSSGKFYSILRPNGPGTKWLAFEDGDGNKVFSYTRTKLKEYEGLEGLELSDSNASRQTAYVAMYIKTSCLKRYLPGVLEEYRAPSWIGAAIDGTSPVEQITEKETSVDVEVYHDEGVIGRKGLQDMFNMKNQSSIGKHFRKYNFPKSTTFYEVRRKLAQDLDLDDVRKLRMFIMRNGTLGQYGNAQLDTPRPKRTIGDKLTTVRPFCLWCSTLKTEEDVKLFGYPEKKAPVAILPEVPALGNSAEDANSSNHPPVATNEQNQQTSPVLGGDTTAHVATADPTPELADAIDGPNSPEAVMEDAPAEQGAAEVTVVSEIGAVAPVSDEQQTRPASEILTTMEDVVPTTPDRGPEGFPAVTMMQEAPSDAPTGDALPSTISETAPAVEHGHLIDAVMSDTDDATPPETGMPAFLPSLTGLDGSNSDAVIAETVSAVQESQVTANEQEMADANEAAIAALIAADTAAIDMLSEATPPNPVALTNSSDQTQQVSSEGHRPTNSDNAVPPPPDASSLPVVEAVPPPPVQSHPVRNVYGFLQIFNASKQEFSVHSTFFAKRDEPLKEVMRRCLGYDKEKAFHAWHRESNLDGAAVNDKVTFDDVNFADGVDVVVGEILSDDQVADLRKEGKFSNPFALSRYLHLRERNHPTLAATSSEPVEIADFGSHFYCGPLVNGQPHGLNCTLITTQGHTYNGPLVMSQKSGATGKMMYQNGDTYDGEWLNDERHGEGTFIEKRTGNKYVGGFMNGKRWGKGTTHWEMADEEADMCQICYGEDIDALFFDCGHVCACVDCAKQCSVCPICRKEVKEVVKMFWA